MKKLLTILTLALALCLLCSVAMADTVKLSGTAYENATQSILAHGAVAHLWIDADEDGTDDDFVLKTNVGGWPCLKTDTIRYEGVGSTSAITYWFEVIYTKPHTVPAWHVIKDPTCTEQGQREGLCTRCGEHVIQPIAPLGHNWGIWGITKAPTCTETGEYGWLCTRCGAPKPGTETQVIAKIQHSWFSVAAKEGRIWTKVPTCKEDGVYYIGCKYCGKSAQELGKLDTNTDDPAGPTPTISYNSTVADYIGGSTYYQDLHPDYDPDGHDFDEWVPGKEASDKATCSHAGNVVRWCLICGEKQIKVDWDNQPAKKADYVLASQNRVDDDCYKVEMHFVCANCNSLSAEHPEIVFVCEKGKVPAVKAVKTVKNQLKAGPSTIASTEAEDAELCNINLYAKQIVYAHDYIYTAKYYLYTVYPTCEGKGYDVYKCRCEDGTIAYDEIHETLTGVANHDLGKTNYKPALGHDWTDWEEVYAPGEYLNQYGVWTRTCKRCGKTDNQINENPPVELCNNNHTWEVIEAESTYPTCTTEGLMSYICSVCKETKTETAPATGHTFGDYKTTKAATCKEEGEAIRICSVCKFSETKTLAKTGHTYDAGKVTKEPTGTSTGVKTFTCTVCGATKTEEIPKLPVAAEYDVKNIDYTNPVATGVAELKAGTDALEKAYARVTFFLANGDCMVQIVDVAKDGSFTAGAIGNFVHISVVIVDVDDAYGADEAIEHAFGNGGKKL